MCACFAAAAHIHCLRLASASAARPLFTRILQRVSEAGIWEGIKPSQHPPTQPRGHPHPQQPALLQILQDGGGRTHDADVRLRPQAQTRIGAVAGLCKHARPPATSQQLAPCSSCEPGSNWHGRACSCSRLRALSESPVASPAMPARCRCSASSFTQSGTWGHGRQGAWACVLSSHCQSVGQLPSQR